MSPGRVFGRLLATVAVVFLLGAGVLWWLMSTESGSRRVVAFILGKTPEGLEIADVRGSLAGELYLKGIQYRSGALSAEVDSAMLDLRPSQLVRGRIMLARVRVAGMRVVLPDSTPEDTAGTAAARSESPSPPIPIEIGEAVISRFELDAPGGLSVRQGAVTVAGSLDNYRFDLTGIVFVPQIDTARIDVGGTGTTRGVRLDSTSSAEMLGGRVIPVGEVSWFPSVTWDLDIAVDSVLPARVFPSLEPLTGRVSLQAKTAGGIDTAGPNGTATLDSIAGTVRGRPLEGRASVRFRTLVLEQLAADLRWGPARIRARGFVGDTLGISYEAEVVNLGGFVGGGSGRGHLVGTVTGPGRSPRIRADIRGADVRVGGFEAQRVTGRADVDLGRGGRLAISLATDSATVLSRPFERVTITAEGRTQQHSVAFRGTNAADTLSLRLAGGIRNRGWQGRIDSLVVLSAIDRWELEDPAPLVLSGAVIRLDSLCVVADSLAGRACAQAEWRGAGRWHLVADVDSVRLDRLPLARPMAGAVVGRLEVRNSATGLDATVSATFADSGQRVGELEGTATMPGYRLGRSLAQQPIDARIRARLGDPEFLAPWLGLDSLRGVLTADLHGTGVARAPSIEGEVRADRATVVMNKRKVSGSLVVEPRFTIATDRTVAGEVRLVSPQVVMEQFHADSAVATLVADAEGMRASVGMTVRDAEADSIAGFRVEARLPGYHRLRKPPPAQVMSFTLEVTVPDLAVVQPIIRTVDSVRGNGVLAIDGRGPIGTPTITGALRVAGAGAVLPMGTEIRGGLSGDLELVVLEDRAIRGSLRIVPEEVRLAANRGDTTSEVRVRDAALDIQAGAEGVRATLDARLSTDADTSVAVLEARASLPEYRRVGPRISRERFEATVSGRVDDFGFLPAFFAVLDSAAGTMTFDARLDGTVADSRMTGGAEVKDVTLRFPTAGITVEDINLTAKGDDAGLITVKASARSGPGDVVIEGHTPVRPTREKPGLLSVRGQNFLASHSDQVHAVISPGLAVTLAGDTLEIRGQLDVPVARIQLVELPEVAVKPSDDIVFVGDPGESDRERPIIANVRVALGDSVSFQGFNFNAELSGALNLLDMPDRPTRASGTLIIEEGYYRSYGQDLSVTNGSVSFSGDLDNPRLNIRAQRVVQDTLTVGIAMTGSLKDPDVRLFANTPMAQTQMLSYIVTGGPVGGSGSSGNLVNKALSALGLSGSSQIVNALGEDIGLSSARIETEGDLQDASLVVGKYLSPKVYISYGVGLFDPVTTLRLRYILSSKFTLLAEAGRETSADAVIRVKSKR